MSGQVGKPRTTTIPTHLLRASIGQIPHLDGAECRDGDGFVAHSEYLEASVGDSNERAYLRDAAAEFCRACPAKQACLAWVLADEKPPGKWGGMYGGLTPKARRQRIVSIKTEATA